MKKSILLSLAFLMAGCMSYTGYTVQRYTKGQGFAAMHYSGYKEGADYLVEKEVGILIAHRPVDKLQLGTLSLPIYTFGPVEVTLFNLTDKPQSLELKSIYLPGFVGLPRPIPGELKEFIPSQVTLAPKSTSTFKIDKMSFFSNAPTVKFVANNSPQTKIIEMRNLSDDEYDERYGKAGKAVFPWSK